MGALSTNGEDERKPFPRIVPGTVLGRKASGTCIGSALIGALYI